MVTYVQKSSSYFLDSARQHVPNAEVPESQSALLRPGARVQRRAAVCEYVRSRVALSPVILRALDELPPLTGTMLGPPGPVALLGPCVVVAPGAPLAEVAERYLPRVGGAILVGHTDVPWAPLVLEARAYGAAAMVRIDRPVPASSSDPVIFVVDDSELADRLEVPYLA